MSSFQCILFLCPVAVLLSNVINGIDIQNLMTSDSLSRQTIQGDLVFTGNMDVMSSLTTEAFMNDCNLALVSSACSPSKISVSCG